MSTKCPICDQGNLVPRVDKSPATYKGHHADLDLYYSVCECCGSEQSDPIQLRDNKRGMVAFKKKVDGLLSGMEVRAVRQQLNLNQAEAAKLFGGGPVAFSKYEADVVAQSEAMDKLLRLAVNMPKALFLSWRKSILEGGEVVGWETTSAAVSKEESHERRIVTTSTPDDNREWRPLAAC